MKLRHSHIALGYALSAASMLLLAFLVVLAMRWQLAYPGKPLPLVAGLFGPNHPWMPNGMLLPNFYNQLTGMHGTLMIFLAVVPMLVGGFGLYLTPLLTGARRLAFPRLSIAGLAFHLLGIALILGSFFAQGGPASTGWTAYAPLSILDLSGQTWWLLGIAAVYLSSLCVSINLIVTVLNHRALGMTLAQMPFFLWTQLITGLLLVLAFPPLVAAAILQLMDRLRGTSFFLPGGLVVNGEALSHSGGGSAILWQHLFWFLAHPEVYVLLLPAFGIVGEIISTNTRRPLFARRWMVVALLVLGVLSMLVWAHHMFLTGMGVSMSTFFQATTVIISVPSIVIGMGLLLTLWGARIHFTTPMVWALGFLPMFAVGGFTGLPLALGSTNVPLHDTMYVVGHFHFIAAPGILFALFAGIYHWWPRITGRHLHHGLGKAHFWLSFLGMNGVFIPMMLLGLAGVNRRLYDGGVSYAHANEVHWMQVASTHSAFLLGAAQLIFLVNLFWSGWRGAKVQPNPWGATTLEWEDDETAEPNSAAADSGFTSAGLGMGLLILSLALLVAALDSSFLLLRADNPAWPRVEFHTGWWCGRGVLLALATIAAWLAAKRGARGTALLLLATAALCAAAACSVAMEHAAVRTASEAPARAHLAFACYYLLTGFEGVLALCHGVAALVLAAISRRVSPAARRSFGYFGGFLVVLWAIHFALLTLNNGTGAWPQ